MPTHTVDPRHNPLIDPKPPKTPITEVQRRRKFLSGWIQAAQFFVGLFGIASILGGIGLAMTTVESDSFLSGNEHPFIGWGIGAAIAGAALTAFMLAVLAFLDLRLAESEAA